MIHHVCHPREDRIMAQGEIADTYNIRCNFLEALSIRQSIPFEWRAKLMSQFSGDPTLKHEFIINIKRFNILNSGPKQWYSEWVKKVQTPFNRAESWQRELGVLPLQKPPDWEKVFVIPYKSTRETKLQAFVFKVLYRLTPCNKHLHTLRIKDSHKCSFCDEVDTITHFFCECHTVRAFWSGLKSWCSQYLDIALDRLSMPEILLGVTRKVAGAKVMNWLIIQAKFYIQKRKLFHQANVALAGFLAEVRLKLFNEKQMCLMENKTQKFRVWKRMYKILE